MSASTGRLAIRPAVPNGGGISLALSLGFRLARRCVRMRLGPPVPGFRPEKILNVFSLAVG